MTGKDAYFTLSLFLLLTLTSGCHWGRKDVPDVSHIPISVRIDRFGQDFMSMDTADIKNAVAKMRKKYPEFLPVYLGQIMNFGVADDSDKVMYQQVGAFIKSSAVQKLQDTINIHFPPAKIKQISRDLQKGFRYIKYYFPRFHPPQVVAFMSGMANYGAITVDTVLGIGLDMFLGKNFSLYKRVANPYPDYILKQFSPKYLVAGCLKVMEQKLFPLPLNGTLLDQMIAQGKQLYFLDKVMPYTSDPIKMGYSSDQIKWCKENEQFIWQYFVRQDLLYNKSSLTIRYYIGAGPSSRGMPSQAPGNIGSWIGWQIVRKYMDEHPKTTLSDLMKEKDAQKILTDAHYRPH